LYFGIGIVLTYLILQVRDLEGEADRCRMVCGDMGCVIGELRIRLNQAELKLIENERDLKNLFDSTFRFSGKIQEQANRNSDSIEKLFLSMEEDWLVIDELKSQLKDVKRTTMLFEPLGVFN